MRCCLRHYGHAGTSDELGRRPRHLIIAATSASARKPRRWRGRRGTLHFVDAHEELRKEAARIAEDAEFTGYQHLATGQRWRTWATRIGLPVTIVSAATSAGAGLSVIAGGATWLTAGLAFVGAMLAAIRLFFRPDEQASAHSSKGARYITLRDDARRFRTIDVGSALSLDALTDRVHQLGSRLNVLREHEPRELPADLYPKVKAQIEGQNYVHKADEH